MEQSAIRKSLCDKAEGKLLNTLLEQNAHDEVSAIRVYPKSNYKISQPILNTTKLKQCWESES